MQFLEFKLDMLIPLSTPRTATQCAHTLTLKTWFKFGKTRKNSILLFIPAHSRKKKQKK